MREARGALLKRERGRRGEERGGSEKIFHSPLCWAAWRVLDAGGVAEMARRVGAGYCKDICQHRTSEG